VAVAAGVVVVVAVVVVAAAVGPAKENGFGVSAAVVAAAVAVDLLGDAGVKLNVAAAPLLDTDDEAAAKLTAGVEAAAGWLNLNATDG